MKRFSALFLALLLALSLCACGSSSVDITGKYLCTSIVMNDVDLGSSGEWLELNEDGTASIFISGQSRSAEYTLEEGAFTLTINGQTSGTGTLESGVLTMDFMGMTCIFRQEAPAES
ncbi:MAG: hypothetical protein HUJ67_05675 [Ruminiclostridium sp.]|nr:hypothetical protein [Ruminiclostridium sp.]